MRWEIELAQHLLFPAVPVSC